MLNMIYEIIAKLLALQLRSFLPLLVHECQKSFVLGLKILENISITYLTIDWVLYNKSQALLLLLDLKKASNRVDFTYIWATLAALGLGGNSSN